MTREPERRQPATRRPRMAAPASPQAETPAPTASAQAETPPASPAQAVPAPRNEERDRLIESVPSNTPPRTVQQPRQAEDTRAAEQAPARVAPSRQSLRELLARVDNGWIGFRAAAGAIPSERMDERLGEGGWTRKQMLAHVAAWHDLTHDRLTKLINTGQTTELTDSSDAINARVARQAVGRTAGEVLKEMEMTFNRLRRQLVRLTDEQLDADDAWAAYVIAGNTYEHYDEHRADVHVPDHPDSRSGRR
jgi:hypothetical protein